MMSPSTLVRLLDRENERRRAAVKAAMTPIDRWLVNKLKWRLIERYYTTDIDYERGVIRIYRKGELVMIEVFDIEPIAIRFSHQGEE